MRDRSRPEPSSTHPELPASRKRGSVWTLLLLLAVIVVGGVLAGRHLPLAALGAQLEGSGPLGVGLFLMLGVLGTAIGLPRQALAFISGLAWGTSAGLCLSLLAAIGGCAVTVEVSRRFLHARLRARFAGFVNTLGRLVERDAFAKIVALRLQPLGTNLLTNVCAGLTPMSRGTFLSASFVGYIPQMLVFALLGSGVRIGSGAQLLTSGALMVISLIIGAVLYRRHVRQQLDRD